MAKNIVIVGGGSSGWMTAAYLSKSLEKVDTITLIESKAIRTIGVGEATCSNIKRFFDFLGLNESDWMPSCNATYKLAIKFENWRSDGGHFYHPFQRYETVDGFNVGEWWLKLKRGAEPFDYSCFTIPALCDSKRSPRYFTGQVLDDKVQDFFAADSLKNVPSDHDQFPYAYHFDAHLLAEYLKGYAIRHGVLHIDDDVIKANLKEDGAIASVETKEHGAIAGDIFVDCSGFRGLLISQALGEPFVSFNDSLLCDRAVAMQIPVDVEKSGINPYTTATAMSAGWVWNIPLYGLNGTGYVYSSAFLSPEEAEAELRAYLGPQSDLCTASHIKMRVGRSRNSWVKNCVAIGLSSSFVEPLESTGSFFIQHSIEELVNHFPNGCMDEDILKSYNKTVADAVDGVRDFLILHYRASNRRDTDFWTATKGQSSTPADLSERLRLWRKRLPNPKNVNPSYHGFDAHSYSVMLLGLDYRPEQNLPVLDLFSDHRATEAFDAIRAKTRHLVATLPSQFEYLQHVRAAA